jgi:hypothetical protein
MTAPAPDNPIRTWTTRCSARRRTDRAARPPDRLLGRRTAPARAPLHDSLGSSMTALTMHLGLLSKHLHEQPQR